MPFPETDPKYDLARFDFDKDPARIVWIHQVLDATDPNLSRYQEHGGKIVMYFGWADAGLNPRMGVEYYEQVSARMGPSTSNFFRLFMVPGMFHCDGGVGVSAFDAMTPLVRWVEKRVVPERIITHASSRAKLSALVRSAPIRRWRDTPAPEALLMMPPTLSAASHNCGRPQTNELDDQG